MSEKLIIYHGSQQIIKEPIYGVGNPKNDYGLGFYCTENMELAKEWACTFESNGYANKYELDINGLAMLNLNGGNYNILNWLSILLENRTFKINSDIAQNGLDYIKEVFGVDYNKYDIIKGYRADDSYFSFTAAFLNNTISLAKLEKAMMLGRLGEQVVLKSSKAFSRIEYVEHISASKEIYYPKKMARDIKARETFKREKSKKPIDDEVFLIDIIRERWDNDDQRLQPVIYR